MSELQTYFVDVIVPVPIHQVFTYRVPSDLSNELQVGIRTVVPFGKGKLLTGIIVKIHQRAPENYQAKYLEMILDEHPIVNHYQFKLWNWISEYYMAPIGDVMNAALPSNFKLASETKIDLHPSFNPNEYAFDNEKYSTIIEILEINQGMDIKTLSERTGIKNVQPWINKLIEKRVLITTEELTDRYSPKTITCINFNPKIITDETTLHEVIANLESHGRNEKQVELLIELLKIKFEKGNLFTPIPKKDLKKMEADSSINTLLKKGIIIQEKFEVDRISGNKESKPLSSLSEAQRRSLDGIKAIFVEDRPCLLHGVTGSGKTEIYVELIQEYLDLGKQVLYLLPEIALTTQLINRLSSYFGEQVGVYHSKFNQNERIEVWNKVLNNDLNSFRIIVGARSSIFLPFQDLGLIIVDEEHESSFKQYDPSPRYNGRDSALVLSRIHHCHVLLGTATPALESYFNALDGKYGLVELKERYADIKLPEVLLADIKKERRQKTIQGDFSSFLLDNVRVELDKNKQVILFQNRRGYNPQWSCEICNWTPRCINCDVTLTYHKFQNKLKCHYCSHISAPTGSCMTCGSNRLKMIGFGTEKIEDELTILLKDRIVKRLDLDTTQNKNAYRDLIFDFEQGNIDVLVGTQMISKGLDFDSVSMVGILDADMLLNRPDFRAFERSYHLISQVAGRAGRKNERGKVIVQTGNPDHWIFQYIMNHDYEGFYKQEIIERKNYHYPPYFKLIKLTLRHKELEKLDLAAQNLSDALRAIYKERIMGPEYPIVRKIQNFFLKEIQIKYERQFDGKRIKSKLKEVINNFYASSEFKSVKLTIDVDPI